MISSQNRKTNQVCLLAGRVCSRFPTCWHGCRPVRPGGILGWSSEIGPKNIPQLNEIIARLETDEHVKVVVFDSAVEGFFLTHYDFLAKPEDQPSMPPGRTGLQPLPDMLARLQTRPARRHTWLVFRDRTKEHSTIE